MKGMLYTGLAMELVGMIAGGVYLGNLVKEHYGIKYAPFIGFLVAFGGWTVRIMHIIRKEMQNMEQESQEEKANNENSGTK